MADHLTLEDLRRVGVGARYVLPDPKHAADFRAAVERALNELDERVTALEATRAATPATMNTETKTTT